MPEVPREEQDRDPQHTQPPARPELGDRPASGPLAADFADRSSPTYGDPDAPSTAFQGIEASDGALTSDLTQPFAGTFLSTTGVPHYPPPARVPDFSVGSGIEAAAAGFGAAAPPRRRAGSILRPVGRLVREVAETVILALLIFLLVRAVVQNFQVEGRSMEPTLETNWYLLVNKALYWEINLETLSKFVPFLDPGDDPTRYVFRGPRRGDIIVFVAPDQAAGQAERDFIKRIIGLPGETVEVHDCTVFVNGKPLDEPYIDQRPTYTYGPETVPPGHYFVLGDNRNNSSDSHSWGMLPKKNIIGQAWLTYWPFGHFGLIDNTSVEPGAVSAQQNAAGKFAATCP